MGVHYILPARVGDGELDAMEPEALIYEPLSNGRWRLVGVGFIVLVDDWNSQHPDAAPSLDGHLLRTRSNAEDARLAIEPPSHACRPLHSKYDGMRTSSSSVANRSVRELLRTFLFMGGGGTGDRRGEADPNYRNAPASPI